MIASASEEDGEAAWSGHRSRKAVHSCKAHVGADADTALVAAVSVTPGNVNDSRAGPGALPEVVGEVYADSAHRRTHSAAAVRLPAARPGSRPRSCGRARKTTRSACCAPSTADQSCPRPDREDPRHVQAVLWASPHALARLGHGGPAGAPDGDRLQLAPNFDDSAGEVGSMNSERSLQSRQVRPSEPATIPIRAEHRNVAASSSNTWIGAPAHRILEAVMDWRQVERLV